MASLILRLFGSSQVWFGFEGGVLDYIEEPVSGGVEAMLRWSSTTGLKFGIDETVYDIVSSSRWNWAKVEASLESLVDLGVGPGNCGAVILKPGLIGYGMSYKIAEFVRLNMPGVEVVLTGDPASSREATS